LRFSQYRKGTGFETEEDVSKENFEKEEEKLLLKQHPINQMYSWISIEIGVITG